MKTALPKAYLLSFVYIDPESTQPIYRQIYESLRQAIISERLKAGLRLPSTRDTAKLLGVSRNTVLEAVNQLIAEGYLEAKAGSGTRVTSNLPDNFAWKEFSEPPVAGKHVSKRTISKRGEVFAAARFTQRLKATLPFVFTLSLPALDHFPFDIWSRLVSHHTRNASLRLLDYSVRDRAGYAPLREAIAEYASTARAVKCTPDQVIITNGAQHAIFIASHVLLDPGDKAWMENPGHMGVRSILTSAGAQIIPVPVDDHGLDVEAGIAAAPDACLVCITPHQLPVGSTMNLKRRLELLRWANQQDAWIVEDDYDHEFHYTGRPLMSLQGLDKGQRVIYVGTFSKSMFPSLRIGYMIVPPDLVQAFTSARLLIDVQTPTIQQAALNDFIREGHFSRHIRRTRQLYSSRRTHLLEQIEQHLGEWITPGIADSGMQMTGWLPDSISDKAVCAAGEQEGLDLVPVSRLYIGSPARSGLLLGYAAAREEDLTVGVKTLQRILSQYTR